MSESDPFDDYEESRSEAIKLESVGAWVKFEVTEVGTPFEAEFGEVLILGAEVLQFGGGYSGPGVHEVGSFLLSYAKSSGEPSHVRQVLTDAIKKAGRQLGSMEVGDVYAVKRSEDVTHSKAGKKFAFPFRRHVAVAYLPPASDAPF